MSSLRLLLVFSEAARRGSFAAAARELGLSSSAVVKGVARLELALRMRLFHRTTRRIRLTQEGEALFERCRRILAEVEELERAAANVSQLATGVLRIDAPVTYGRQVVLPVLARLAADNPGLEIDLRLSDVYADVISSGLDAVVRAGEVADSQLIAHAFDSQHVGDLWFTRLLRAKGSRQGTRGSRSATTVCDSACPAPGVIGSGTCARAKRTSRWTCRCATPWTTGTGSSQRRCSA